MLLVVATMLHSTWLAAILTFGSAYPLYERRAATWGVDPLHDQQLAGSLMWVVPAIAYLVILAALFVRWLHELDARHPRTWTQVETP
jgi:putative membrane protein